MSETEPSKTHFGFEQVSPTEKTERVAEVFRSVATRYDVMNDLMSFGIHRLWKRMAIELASLRPTHWVLDIAAGTGDLSLRMAPLLTSGHLFVTDINEAMLQIAQTRMIENGFVDNVHYLQVNAEMIPFSDNTFDCITIGFGLRNVTDKQKALSEMYRALKPSGKVIILEFSHPTSKILSQLYDVYSFKCLPLLGKFVAQDEKSYQYLAESIRMHPDQPTLRHLLERAGFENCDYQNLTGGIVAIHRGFKFD